MRSREMESTQRKRRETRMESRDNIDIWESKIDIWESRDNNDIWERRDIDNISTVI